MTHSLRKLTALGIFAGFLLALVITLAGATPAYADGGGVGSGGSGGGGGGGGGGCAANRTLWRFTHGTVPPVGHGCINDTLTGSSCHTSANVGSWVFYVTATSGSNAGRHISLPTSSQGFGYMTNTLTGQIESANNINAGFTTSGGRTYNNAPTRVSIMRAAESVISDGKYGVGGGAQWKERGSNIANGNYKDSAGKSLTYVCVWIDIDSKGHCSGVCGTIHTQQYCSDYGVTSAKYAIRRGVSVTSTKASSSADALAKCVLHCPTSSSSDPNHVRAYLRHSGAILTSGYNTPAKQGAYCYHRTPGSRTETRTQTKITGSAKTSPYYRAIWTTSVQGDDGAQQRTHPGPTKFAYQSTDANSLWGQLLQTTGKTCPTAAAMAAASGKDATAAHASVKLSATNLEASAEGGILDISEFTVYAASSSSTTVHQPQVSTRIITVSWSFTLINTGAEYGVGNYASGSPKTTVGAWSAWKNSGAASSTCTGQVVPQTPQQTSFFQAYANHCDANAYNGHTLGNTVVANGDTAKNFSGSLVTPRVANGSYQTLGYGHGDRAGQFDKLCSYDGTRNSTGSDTTASVQAKVNGTVATGATAGPGAVTFFRDNVQHPFTVDHYVPMTEGVVTYDGHSAALATVISLWSGGTPQAPGVTNKGQFQMTLGGTSIFSASTAPAPTLTDWSMYGNPTFSGRTLGIEGGDYSTLNVAADWPSDAGKPTVFTVKWIYAPQVSNVVPTTVGFTNTEARTYTLGAVSTAIQGEVYGKQGTASSTSGALPTEVAGSTGSAPTATSATPVNSLDGVLHFGTVLDRNGAWLMKPDAYSPYYHSVSFLRAVGS